MKRSRINNILREGEEMIKSHGFVLPPFANWTPETFKAKKEVAGHVIDARCGWDVTDYGVGRYDEMGLLLFTLRNGRLADLQNNEDGRSRKTMGTQENGETKELEEPLEQWRHPSYHEVITGNVEFDTTRCLACGVESLSNDNGARHALYT